MFYSKFLIIVYIALSVIQREMNRDKGIIRLGSIIDTAQLVRPLAEHS